MTDFLKWVIFWILVLIFSIGLIGIIITMDYASCKIEGNRMGFETKWFWTPGVPCMIKTHSGWIDIDKYRIGVD